MLVVQSLPPSGNQILWKWGHQDPCHWVRLFTWVPIYDFPHNVNQDHQVSLSICNVYCQPLVAYKPIPHFQQRNYFAIVLLPSYWLAHMMCHTALTQVHKENTPQMLEFLCQWLIFWVTCLISTKYTDQWKKCFGKEKILVLLLKRYACIKDAKVSGWETWPGYYMSWH